MINYFQHIVNEKFSHLDKCPSEIIRDKEHLYFTLCQEFRGAPIPDGYQIKILEGKLFCYGGIGK